MFGVSKHIVREYTKKYFVAIYATAAIAFLCVFIF